MADRSDLDELIVAKNKAARLALGDLEVFWASLDTNDPGTAWEAIREFLPLLTARYGEVGAVAAAEWYDRLRSNSRATGRYRASIYGPADELLYARMDRDVAALIDSGRYTSAQGVLTLMVGEWVNRWVGTTVRRSAVRDPGRPRVARVPKGATTCAWCLMLASRGAVYASKASALEASHGECDCVVTPLWPGDKLPGGYDPNALYVHYKAAADSAGTSSPKAVAAELRRQLGTH